MNDAMLVCERERASDILHDAERLANAERRSATESDIDRFTIDIRHHEIRESVDISGFQYRNDVRMLKPRHRQYLAAKTLGRYARRQLGRKNLDDDLPSQVVILPYLHERHPAANELALNGVGSAKSGKQAIGDRGH